MITVAILINGRPVAARSAVNAGPAPGGACRYEVDDGSVIVHRPGDGAVELAVKLLGTIKGRAVPGETKGGQG